MKGKKLLTTGDIAARLNLPIHRVQYFLTARRIDPVTRVGGYRLFAADVVEKLRVEIEGKKVVVHAV